jgi:hypothetical protein
VDPSLQMGVGSTENHGIGRFYPTGRHGISQTCGDREFLLAIPTGPVGIVNFCLCVRATGKAHRKQVREWMGGWSDQGL